MATEVTPSDSGETVTGLPNPPWRAVPGICNFRDIGGYPIKGGRGSVRREFIYRSAEPSGVTDAGKAHLRDSLRVSATYDLRSATELKRMETQTPVIDIPGVTRHFAPVFLDVDCDPEHLALRYKHYSSGDLASAYRGILNAGAKMAFRKILGHILNRPTEPLLMHCTAGKDRTGVIAALILLLAGVDEQVIAEEYALTTLGMAPVRKALWDHLIKQPLFASGDEEALRGLDNMLSSRVETMRETIEVINQEFGRVEGYMEKDCGFSKQEIETIRRNIICDDPPCFPGRGR